MKTIYFKTMLTAILAIAFTVSYADTMHSTAAGGDWDDPATWEENLVPGSDDDVVVTGPGAVFVEGLNTSTHDACNNITIMAGAVLRHKTNSIRALDVFGTINNFGAITDTIVSGDLYIHAFGNIINNGIWNNNRIIMEGMVTQLISLGSGKYFGCDEFIDIDNTSNLEFQSDIEFRNCDIDLNNAGLIMPVTKGGKLKILGGRITEAAITGNDGFLEMADPAYLYENVSLSDVTLQGIINVLGTTNILSGEIIVEGTLQNRINGTSSLQINGNIHNEGIIQNTNNSLTLYITGNIYNNGTWQNSNTWLSGTGTHSVTQGTSGSFSGQNFYAEAGTGTITANSDIDFDGVNIDLNNSVLIMPVTKGGKLTILGGRITEAAITGNNGFLEMGVEAYLYENVSLSDVTLQGVVNVLGATNSLSGEIIVEGTLQNRINGSSSLQIDGNVYNEGIIQNTNNSFTLNVTGNIYNNGTWQNTHTWLSGTGTHSVTQGPSGSFSGQNLYAEAGTGTITAGSSIDLNGVNMDLNGGVLELDPAKGAGLSFTSGKLRDGIVYGSGNELSMDTDSYIESLTLHDFVLQGTVPVLTTGVIFEGNTIVEGTLKNYSASASVICNGVLTNNGTIENLINSLTLYLNGTFINTGTCTNWKIEFSSATDQEVASPGGGVIGARYIENTDPLSKIIATDDLTFHTSIIDLNGGEIQMPLGKKFTLTGSSTLEGSLVDGTISGETFDYEGNEYAYIQNITFDPEVTLYGQVEVLTEVDFNGSLNNKDILQLRGLSCAVNVADRIINNGTIQDGSTGNNLTINCQGHIINNGIWDNYRTTLNGVDDQLIYLIAGKEITGEFRFDAMIDDPPYQWKWNGTNLNSADFTGETSDVLIWEVPVSNNYYGYFGCQGAADTSRNIIIRSGIIIDPVVLLQGPYNGVDMDTDLAQQWLIPLSQPFNMPPWNYNGDETVSSIPTNIVDWVLVELRETAGGPETADENTIVMQRALLLRHDGRVVDPWNQTPELKYDIDLTENIYMVIWHRNHLGVISATSLSNEDSPAYYDFSESADKAYGGSEALIDLGNGVYGMMGGDADYNQQITQEDKQGFWDPNAGMPCGYVPYDFNFDGQIDNRDKNQTWVKTLGKSTQVTE
ncbi:MAG: hypothetical protein JW731_09580 [Bacteroidales bacterium]|nr:hypothetical protein [Bacteroidales bacterium]